MKAIEKHPADPDIVLIDPPFGSINGPSIGLPVLASHLRNRGIGTSVIDLNNRFYAALLTEQNIRAGLEYLENRFVELNRKSVFAFSQMVEYEIIVRLLLEKDRFASTLAGLLALGLDPGHIRSVDNMRLVRFLIQLATVKNFPEMIHFTPRLKKTDRLSKYASKDLVKAVHQEDFYTKIFENILNAGLFEMKPVPLVGISVSFNDQAIPAFQLAGMIKKKWPDVHMVLGGAFVSIHFRKINNPRVFEIFDSLILDEGEIPLEILFRKIDSDNPNRFGIPNLIACRDGRIQYAETERHPPEKLSFTGDYTLFDLDQYLFSPENVVMPFCLSRGCKWKKCTFCRTDIPVFHNYGRPSPQALYEQLLAMVRKHGAKTVSFSSAFSEPEVLEHLSKKLLEDKISLRWVASTRLSNDFSRDLCALFRDAGCVRLSFGIESFSDRILALMKKGIRAKQIEKIITGIDGVIPVFLLMMVGFPMETAAEARDGFEKVKALLSRKLIVGYHYNVFHLTYGSDIWNNPEKYHVSDVRWLSENDLFPNVVQFQCPGMSREKAYRLHAQFSGNDGGGNPPEIARSWKNEPLRYDLGRIREKIKTARNEYIDVCYGKWLQANGDVACQPMHGRHEKGGPAIEK